MRIKNYLNLMRVKHYFKNILIFFPLVFSQKLFNLQDLFKTIVGFATFCIACSIIYIFNDIRDIEKDRKHEVKKNRPLPSKKVTIKEAIILMIILGIILLCSFVNLEWNSIILILIYIFINICYSLGLKNIPLLDIIILVFGYIIRILFGAFIINVPVSNWLYLTVMSSAFYLALGKRRNEIIKSGENTRSVLKLYNKEFLDKNMYICLALAIVFYSLWTVDLKIGHNYLIWTIPFLIVTCMRYNMIIEEDNYGDPIEVILHDRYLQIIASVFSVLLLILVYI